MHSHISHIWNEIQVCHHIVQFLGLSAYKQGLVVLRSHLAVVRKEVVRTLGSH